MKNLREVDRLIATHVFKLKNVRYEQDILYYDHLCIDFNIMRLEVPNYIDYNILEELINIGSGIMRKLMLTEEELDAGIIQLGYRITSLEQLQIQEAKKGNVERVLELQEFMIPIKTLYGKLQEARYG